MSVTFTPRPSNERGNADHGWLKSFHTFSFAGYHDPKHSAFGALRVINEDRVKAHTGFPTHPHANFEIFSYIVDGELEHRDSMGNVEVLKRGDLQLTTAGTGIRHSEMAHGEKDVHFLQIWGLPIKRNVQPQYITRHFNDEQKKNTWCQIVAPDGTPGLNNDRDSTRGAAPLNSPISLNATLLSPGTTLSRALTLPSPSSAGKALPAKAYLHVVQTSGYNTKAASGATVKISVDGTQEVILREGDGLYVTGERGKEIKFENTSDAGQVAEVLVFDVEDV